MSCGGCWMALPRPGAFVACRIASNHAAAVGCGAWGGVGGNGSSAPAGAADRRAGPELRFIPARCKSHSTCSARVVWVNGPSRSRTVMPPSHPPASWYRRPALLLSRPPTPGGSLWPDPGAYDGPRRSLRHRRCWSWWGVAGWVGCVVGRLRRRWRDHKPVPGRAWPVRPAAGVQRRGGRGHLEAAPPADARPGGRSASILLVIAPAPADQANPRRFSRRSARRPCRHPENRRPTPGVLAAQGRCQASLMSATHRR
jgi:hypothetical protein